MPEQNEKKNETQPSARLDSKQIFGNAKMVLIEHSGQVYRLMITRQDKLILNK
jgi:hemin uptake protein HemP